MIYKKQLGQNFLKDEIVIKRFIDQINSNNRSNLIEVGGGGGAISYPVSKNKDYKSFTVYELDERFYEHLNRALPKKDNIKVENINILDTDLNNKDNLYIIGAIPYSITSPLIHKLLSLNQKPEEILLIVQKEVADKILMSTPNANYWSFLTINYDKERIMDIKPESFYPAPTVISTIIKFKLNKNIDKKIDYIDFAKWKKFTRWVFYNPKKMLKNTFKKELLERSNIDPTDRAHDLNLDQILNLYNNIYLNNNKSNVV